MSQKKKKTSLISDVCIFMKKGTGQKPFPCDECSEMLSCVFVDPLPWIEQNNHVRQEDSRQYCWLCSFLSQDLEYRWHFLYSVTCNNFFKKCFNPFSRTLLSIVLRYNGASLTQTFYIGFLFFQIQKFRESHRSD